METPLIPVLTDMEYEGVKVDTDFLRNYSKEISHDIIALKDEIENICGAQFNIDSPKQLGDILFEKMGIKYPGKKQNQDSIPPMKKRCKNWWENIRLQNICWTTGS